MMLIEGTEAEGHTPHPPSKFAVLHKKFAGNSALKWTNSVAWNAVSQEDSL